VVVNKGDWPPTLLLDREPRDSMAKIYRPSRARGEPKGQVDTVSTQLSIREKSTIRN
jgi:hypothetical protein